MAFASLDGLVFYPDGWAALLPSQAQRAAEDGEAFWARHDGGYSHTRAFPGFRGIIVLSNAAFGILSTCGRLRCVLVESCRL